MPPLITLLLLASGAGVGIILWPFKGAVMWGLIIAVLSRPVYQRLLHHWAGQPNLAAGVILLLVLVMGVLPFALITASLAREASAAYRLIETGAWNPVAYLSSLFDALPPWVTRLLDRVGLVDFEELQVRLAAAMAQGSQFIATQALSIGLDTFDFVTSLGITLYLAFFLVRDGDALARQAWSAVPLAPAHKAALSERFIQVVRATVKGSLLVAAIQGFLGGIAFWWLDVKGALLWSVLMAFLSLLPAIGAALVWAPVAVYFLLVGPVWKAAALLAWGVLVIGLIDNLLRPVLVGKDTRMPDAIVMITTLGGMAVFGLNGFVIGPALAAMFMAILHIQQDSRREYNGPAG